jgi:hypothetical protein
MRGWHSSDTRRCDVEHREFCGRSLALGGVRLQPESRPTPQDPDAGMGVGISADVLVSKSVHCMWCIITDVAVGKPRHVREGL